MNLRDSLELVGHRIEAAREGIRIDPKTPTLVVAEFGRLCDAVQLLRKIVQHVVVKEGKVDLDDERIIT